jgi:hypothetical protein
MRARWCCVIARETIERTDWPMLLCLDIVSMERLSNEWVEGTPGRTRGETWSNRKVRAGVISHLGSLKFGWPRCVGVGRGHVAFVRGRLLFATRVTVLKRAIVVVAR